MQRRRRFASVFKGTWPPMRWRREGGRELLNMRGLREMQGSSEDEGEEAEVGRGGEKGAGEDEKRRSGEEAAG